MEMIEMIGKKKILLFLFCGIFILPPIGGSLMWLIDKATGMYTMSWLSWVLLIVIAFVIAESFMFTLGYIFYSLMSEFLEKLAKIS